MPIGVRGYPSRQCQNDPLESQRFADRPCLEWTAVGSWGTSPSAILRDMPEAGLAEMPRSGARKSLSCLGVAVTVLPRLRTQASTNAVSSQGHTVPW